jgi:LacI family transcriptional regulator
MKTTVGDVARSAVLTATVDRVLNNRVGVSATSRHRVHDAARKLGYLPTFESVSLPSKPTHLEFIAPVAKNAFLKRLGKHIEDFAGRLPLIASCTMHRLGSYSPDETLAAVEKMFFEGERAWYSCAPSPEDARHLGLSYGGRRTHCHSCVGHPGVPRVAYVGIDNRIAGRTAAWTMGKMMGERLGTVAVFTGSRSYRGHEGHEARFRSVLVDNFLNLPNLSVIQVAEDCSKSCAEALAVLKNNNDVAGLYCTTRPRPRPCERSGYVGSLFIICTTWLVPLSLLYLRVYR